MSWDNVSSVYTIKIWTDYSDSTQGHLFVNDNHQLKLYVGIDFTLNAGTTEGPGDDEVRNAITLINNMDGGPLKYLTIVDENRYTAVYDPYHTQAVDQDDTSIVDNGVYDNVITYYVSSPSSVNAETFSENVALTLEYHGTSSDGTAKDIFVDTSAVADKGGFATYASVVCYPEKLYGNKGQNRTCITNSSTEISGSEIDDNFDHSEDKFKVYWFNIDDPYFKIFYFDGGNESIDNTPLNPYYIYKEIASTQWDKIYNAFFPNVQCGEKTYDATIKVQSDLNHEYILEEKITVNQKPNQIIFLTSYMTVKKA
ncbi:Uncharacterised protein [Pseudescherichia vulneris]|nr:hypothetical protein [Pseudescherichia vulneris]STQ60764.1 Uncharacterised protein [Pseudescherichia vulneris]